MKSTSRNLPNLPKQIDPHLNVVIMAGGSGTRLWPLSRKKFPKQFIPLFENAASLFDKTLERIKAWVDPEKIWVICGQIHADIIKEQHPEIDVRRVLVEPEAKNTAPALAFASQMIHFEDPKAKILVLPSDHFIPEYDLFKKSVEIGVNALRDHELLITFGVQSSYAATGYGYIEKDSKELHHETYPVKAFHEKPELKLAQEYFASQNHFWNSGMFLWRSETFLSELLTCSPEIAQSFACKSRIDLEKNRVSIFKNIQDISIDYALFEKSDRVAMVPAHFSWNDIGSLRALADIMEKDSHDNALTAKSLVLDGKGNILFSENKTIVSLGLSNLIVVETEDAIFVTHKDREQEVRQVVSELRNQKREELL